MTTVRIPTPTCVRLVVGAFPEIDDRAAAAQVRGTVDLDVTVLGLHEIRTEDMGERDRVVNRRPVEPVRLRVETVVELPELGDETARAPCLAQPVGVRLGQERLVGDVESDLDVDPAEKTAPRLGSAQM